MDDGRTDGQTSRQTAGWMDRYAVHSKFVVVHCLAVVSEKCTVRLRVLMAVSMKITIVGIYHRLR